MTIINLTPHAITLKVGETSTTFAPSGTLARVQQSTQDAGFSVAGANVSTNSFGEVLGLPEPQEDVFLIVSGLVLSALQGSRADVIAPRTDSTAVRNEQGHIVAVTGWLQ